MPLLGGLLVSLFSGLASFFVTFMTQKIAIGLAYVTTLSAVVVVLLVLMRTVLAPLAATVYSMPYAGWLGLVFPPAAGACLTAMATVWSGCVLYAWQRDALKLSASV